MTITATIPVSMDALEGEFIPPLETLPGRRTDRMSSWEGQLDALMAWQAAGGNVDNKWEDCRWNVRHRSPASVGAAADRRRSRVPIAFLDRRSAVY